MHRHILFFAAILFCLISSGCGDAQADALRDHGQETEATVIRKDMIQEKRRGSDVVSLTIMFFAKDSASLAEDEHQNDVLKDTTMSMADRLDKWNPGGTGLGKMMSIDLRVPEHIFDAYETGDKVAVVYLPEDPNVVMLKEQL